MKKRIASLIAALAVTAAGTTAYAAKAWAPADLRSLGSFLLGASETGSADLNDDNVSDIFDMIAMRKSLISSVGDYKETTVPATEEYVKLINRNVISDGVTWLVQSGAATEFSVARAKTVSVTLKGDSSVNNDEEHRPRYAILVNDEPVLTECLSEKEKTVKVLDSDTPTDAVIKVIHLSEANNGPVGVSSITVGSDSALPIIPTSQKPLHIEFVGDSITCAYGVEGKDQYENFKTTTENFLKSYAYLTAKKLDADYSTACYSGYGVISSYSSDGSRNTSGLLGDHYDNAAANAPYNIPWDHSTTPVDVTVVNLGTNDGVYVQKVEDDGAAADAGIAEGDVITAMDGKNVTKKAELMEIMASKRPGDKVEISYLHNKKKYTKSVTLKNAQGNTKVVKSADLDVLGANFREITDAQKQQLSINYGIEVMKVEAGAMKQSGINKGFIIQSVNNQPIRSLEDMEKAVKEASTSKDPVLYIKGIYPTGKKGYFAVELQQQ